MEETRPFTSRPARWESVIAIAYIPVHICLLPRLLVRTAGQSLDAVSLNVVCYVIAALLLLFCMRRFLFRDFNALCDYGPGVLVELLRFYGLLLLGNLAVNLGLMALGFTANPNNETIYGFAGDELGKTAAMAVFLAPIAEELMFRAGLFGTLRHYNRIAAYAVSMALFAVYHVWSFALTDARAWVYVLQYLPAGFLLARIYEKTDSIWGSIFLHMTVNGVSMLIVSQLGAYL